MVPGGLYLTCAPFAGFYCHIFGPLPLAIVRTSPDQYIVVSPPFLSP